MGLLDQLLGQPQKQQEYKEFAQRYEQGAPWDGISNQEAANRYQEVAPNLSDSEYEQAAADSFSRLSPQQRREFGTWLQQRSGGGGADVDQDGRDDRLEDPQHLAQMTNQVRKQQPDLLSGLLGGGMGSMLGGGGGGAGNMLQSPIGKAALAGIAAMAAKQMMNRR